MITPSILHAALAKARELDLSDTRLQALSALSHRGSETIGRVCSQLGISYAALTGLADSLEALRYAQRTRTSHDRRIIHLAITPHGRQALADVLAAANAAAWENLTPAAS
jgi:DNA-binding MarR family transcriptional regulator